MSQLESFLKLAIIKNARKIQNQFFIQIALILFYIGALIYFYFFTYLISFKALWVILICISIFFNVLIFVINLRDRGALSFGHTQNEESWKKIQYTIGINIVVSILLLSFVYGKKTSVELLSTQSEYERDKLIFRDVGKYNIHWVNESSETIFIKFQHSYYASSLKVQPGKSIPVQYDKLTKEYWLFLYGKGKSGCKKFIDFLPQIIREGSIFRLVYNDDGVLKINAIEMPYEKLNNQECDLE